MEKLKQKSPYIDENYKRYEDERWTCIPAIKVLKTKAKLTENEQKKANNFEKFIKNKDTN
jgi:hypothetical protein